MATPLAGLLLLGTLPVAAGEPCPVPYDPPAPGGAEYEAGAPACRRAQELLPFIRRVAQAADLGEVEVVITPKPFINAYYQNGRVTLTQGILVSPHTEPQLRFVMAHEIAHGVQERRPEASERQRLWAQAPITLEGNDAFAAFSRRYEAQADAIALELLSRLGFDGAYARGGVEGFFGCSVKDGVGTSHPTGTRRVINGTLGERFFADASKLGAAEGAAAFDGALARERETDPEVQPPYRPPAFIPAARVEDFKDDGTLKPGRLAYQRHGGLGSVPDPLPPVRPSIPTAGFDMESWLAPSYIALVNELAEGPGVQARVMLACGTSGAEQVAEDFGPGTWSRRVALALATAR